MAIQQIWTDQDGMKVGILKDWRINPLTTSERTALGFTLGSSHIGLSVFDIDTFAQYFWSGSVWLTTPIPDLSGYLTIASAATTYTPLSRILTVNGQSFDLSADRSWTLVSGVSSVFGRSGAVTALSTDYSSFYYPLTGNPSGFLSSVPAQSFASLTGKPTTIAGYGITDFNSLGDARWSLLAHTHTFTSLTSKPTTLSGYGITDAYPLTGNPSGFLTSFTETDPIFVASAAHGIAGSDITNWNSKQAQLNGTGFVKATGTTISYDNSTYLTGNQTVTLSGDISGSGTTAITTAIGAGKVTNTMLAPMTSAQLAGIISDETGTGLAVFNANPTLAGATFTDVLRFSPDNTYDIGTATAVRPRDIWIKGNMHSVSGYIESNTGFYITTALNNGISFLSTTDGILKLGNYATTDFSRLQFGGTTSSFPAIKRNAAAINFRLADDSADAAITASTISLTNFTSGTIPFFSTGGAVATSGNLLWDNTNFRLLTSAINANNSKVYIGINFPQLRLTSDYSLTFNNTNSNTSGGVDVSLSRSGAGTLQIGDGANNANGSLIATSLTVPLHIGGTGTTSTLTYKTTTGVGATGADHIFLVGNNGSTEAMRILNNGNIRVGIGQILVPDGSSSAPSISFTNSTNTGFYKYTGAPILQLTLGGTPFCVWGNNNQEYSSAAGFVWSTTTDPTGVADVFLKRSTTATLKISSDGTTGAANLIVNGNIGIGTTSLTSRLTLPAGTATANTAPLKFTAGTVLGTPEAGTIEYVTGAFVLQSDKLGIGTISPSYPLHVKQNINNESVIQVENANSGNTAYSIFRAKSDNVNRADFGITSSTFTPYGALGVSNGYMYSDNDICLMTFAGIKFAVGGNIEKMRLSSTGQLGIGGTPVATAKLEIVSTTQGFLPPRMTTTQKNAISSPAEALIIYDTTLHKLCVFTGTVWETVTSL